MTPWSRHRILQLRFRDSHPRLPHLHRWWKRSSDLASTTWRCDGCPKVITSRQVLLADGADAILSLFSPLVPEMLGLDRDSGYFLP